MKKLFRQNDKITYYASDDGKIFSLRKKSGIWRELKPKKTNDGYQLFDCCLNGKPKGILVHRAVWEAFNGKIPAGLEINHINCVRDDNRLVNLELVTRLQNNRYAPTREHRREAQRWRMKPVLDVSTGVIYESANAAARALGLNQGNITHCCNGRYHHTGGHQFKFLTEEAES